MKVIVNTLFVSILCGMLGGCALGKKTAAPDVPQCIQKIISERSNQPGGPYCKDYSISLYLFQGKKVYVIDPGSCGADMMSPVYDSECNELGALGGFVGNSKINGISFKEATFLKKVYENNSPKGIK